MSGLGLLGVNGAFYQNVLDLRQQRHDIIAANVANVDTPGYKARRIDFESAMQEAMTKPGDLPMAATSRQHLPTPYMGPVTGEVYATETPIPKGDGNSVDLEQEMSHQAANEILYNYGVQTIGGQIRQLRMVIEGNTGG